MSFTIKSADEISSSLIVSLKYGLALNVEVIQYDNNVSSYTLSKVDVYTSDDSLPIIEGLVDGSYRKFSYTTDFYVEDDRVIFIAGSISPDHLSNFKVEYRYRTAPAKYQSFNVGTNVRTLLDAIAAEINRSNYSFIDTVYNMIDVDSASGELLEQLIKPFVGSIDRKQAAPSSGIITVENTTAGIITINLTGNQTTFRAVNGLIFKASAFNSEVSINIPAGETHVIYVICDSPGSFTNIPENQINSCIDIVGLNVDNPDPIPSTGIDNYHGYSGDDDNVFAGGSDLETDEELRDRFKSVLFGLEAGSLNSIRQKLLKINGVSSVTVTDSKTNKMINYDEFYVTCYDGSGNIITSTNTTIYEEILVVMSDKAPVGINGTYTVDDHYACYIRLGSNDDFNDTADFVTLGLIAGTDTLDRPGIRYYPEIIIHYDKVRTSDIVIKTEVKSRLKKYINDLDIGSIVRISRIHELITGIVGVNRARITGATHYLNGDIASTFDDTSLYWQDKGDVNLLMTNYKPRMRDIDILDAAIDTRGE